MVGCQHWRALESWLAKCWVSWALNELRAHCLAA